MAFPGLAVLVGLTVLGTLALRGRAVRRMCCPTVPDRLCIRCSAEPPRDLPDPDRIQIALDVQNVGDLMFSVVRVEAKVTPREEEAALDDAPLLHEALEMAHSLRPGEHQRTVIRFAENERYRPGRITPDDRKGLMGLVRAEIRTFAGRRHWTPWARVS